MSDLIKVLSCVRKAKGPLTADEVAEELGIKREVCNAYLARLALAKRVKRTGRRKRDKVRPAVLYAPRKC